MDFLFILLPYPEFAYEINFIEHIKINEIQYTLKAIHGTFLNHCENKPLITFVDNLLKKRLTSYLDKKMTNSNRIADIISLDSGITIY